MGYVKHACNNFHPAKISTICIFLNSQTQPSIFLKGSSSHFQNLASLLLIFFNQSSSTRKWAFPSYGMAGEDEKLPTDNIRTHFKDQNWFFPVSQPKVIGEDFTAFSKISAIQINCFLITIKAWQGFEIATGEPHSKITMTSGNAGVDGQWR